MRRSTAFLAGLVVSALAAAAPTPGIVPFAGDAVGFEQALSAREFEFPRDHGPHAGFRHEWWYLTGHLAGPAGERFGFELTFFRVALKPPQAGASVVPESHWRTTEIYVAHFALTDIGRQQFKSSQRYSRAALGLSGAAADPLHVWVGDWSLQAADGRWTVKARQPGYAIELSMSLESPIIANGERGLSQKSANPADASYYYSMPRLSVRGEVIRAAERVPVSGEAWLDREWGSGGLAADEAGWDWFALQLADGSALMFYSLRHRDGSVDAHSAGTFIAVDGRVLPLGTGDVEVQAQASWASPRGGRYPSRWKLRIPSLSLALELNPVLADQELDVQPRYWEGAVDVAGMQGTHAIKGEGYVELVGYSRSP